MTSFNFISFFNFLNRNRLYTAINVFGFAVSLMFVILMAVYVAREISVDDFQEKKDRIFRLTSEDSESFAYLTGRDLLSRYPEIENVTALYSSSSVVAHNDRKLMADILTVDSSFFSIFSYPLAEGTRTTVLQAATDAVVSEEFARKMFGTESPVGQTIEYNENEKILLTITGVVKDFGNSFMDTPDLIIRADQLHEFVRTTYNVFAFPIYLLVCENADLTPKLPDMLAYFKEHYWIYQNEGRKEVRLEALKDVYFSPVEVSQNHMRQGSWKRIGLLASVGLLILIFAVINYINLSVAQAGMRAKEMATRRLLGGTRWELFVKLITESVLLCAISFIAGFLLAVVMEPTFNSLMQTHIAVQDSVTPLNVLYATLFVTGLGTLAGIVPASVISNYRPIKVVQGTFRRKTKMVYSKVLITFQYFITIVLIGCTFTITRQIRHMLDADLGYKTDYLIHIENTSNADRTTLNTFQNEASKIPGVETVSLCQGTPVHGGNNETQTYPEIGSVRFEVFKGDSAFFKILGLEILQDNHAADPKALWLNETALKTLGIPADSSFSYCLENRPIAGIVKDFTSYDVSEPIRPMVIEKLPETYWPWQVMVRISGSDPADTFKKLEKLYSQLTEGAPFTAKFADQIIQSRYEEQIRLSKTIGALSVIAMIIASLGILAMATYFIQQRSLEIAVRKVYGSTKAEILNLLVFNFIRLVLIAFVLAIPVIWYFMKDWLAGYTVHISLDWTIFAVAGTAVATVALLTVFWQSWRASNANPVESIKR